VPQAINGAAIRPPASNAAPSAGLSADARLRAAAPASQQQAGFERQVHLCDHGRTNVGAAIRNVGF
jgi:hypothetical protein